MQEDKVPMLGHSTYLRISLQWSERSATAHGVEPIVRDGVERPRVPQSEEQSAALGRWEWEGGAVRPPDPER